jgi:hypothetical protein
MKIHNYKILSPFILIMLIIATLSCKDEWNKHFTEEPAKVSGVRLADYIKSVPELSKFYQMLSITGYDSILNASQTYTVWAPNNDALQNVDLNSTMQVLDIVKNHITRFSYPTSGIQSKYIRMINGKLILFSRDDAGFHFGNNKILNPDKLVANGIIHVIDSYEPFHNNIWEYIVRTPGLDSLKAYINSQHKKLFNLDGSTAMGVDSMGNSIYDSAFIESNVLFNTLGHLDIEDSVYTAILPDNTAWNEAYSRIKLYYISNNPTLSAEIQRAYTQISIVRDIVFRKRINTPNSLDSLVSTTGNVFHKPGYLFNATAKEVSNGLVYVTSKLQYKATDSWFKKIKVEAENSYGRTNSNSNIYLRYSFGSSFNVSNKGYILVEPTTTSMISKVYVDFSIPYTLSTKYNIYCVFVPGSIVDPADLLPYRAIFSLITLSNGKVVTTQPLDVVNNVTDPNGITKMLVAENFILPNCDLSLESNEYPTANIKLRVQNDVGIKETTLSRTMRIDYILFEPAE